MVAIQHTQESAKNVRKESSVARIVGSGSAGVLELALFHPVPLTSPFFGFEDIYWIGRYDCETINE